MRAGDRNTLVTVLRLKRGMPQDQAGHLHEHKPENWELASDVGNGGTLWAKLVPRGSREFFRQDQVHADVSYMVEVLYAAGLSITTAMRMQIGKDQFLNIAGKPINTAMRNHTLSFPCTEVVEG